MSALKRLAYMSIATLLLLAGSVATASTASAGLRFYN